MDAVWSSPWFWGALFVISSFFNFRAAFKLLIDWKGMATTCRFVEDAYERLDRLPDEAALEPRRTRRCSSTSFPPTRSRRSRTRCGRCSAPATHTASSTSSW